MAMYRRAAACTGTAATFSRPRRACRANRSSRRSSWSSLSYAPLELKNASSYKKKNRQGTLETGEEHELRTPLHNFQIEEKKGKEKI
jgi:hypothetical protein